MCVSHYCCSIGFLYIFYLIFLDKNNRLFDCVGRCIDGQHRGSGAGGGAGDARRGARDEKRVAAQRSTRQEHLAAHSQAVGWHSVHSGAILSPVFFSFCLGVCVVARLRVIALVLFAAGLVLLLLTSFVLA